MNDPQTAQKKIKDFALGLKLHQPPPYLKDFPFQDVWWPPKSHMGKPVVADGLSHADSNHSSIIAPGCQIVIETLPSRECIIGMGILGLNVIQEDKQHLRVSVEENPLKPELLTYLLPVPSLVVHVREGGVEEEGGKGLVLRR